MKKIILLLTGSFLLLLLLTPMIQAQIVGLPQTFVLDEKFEYSAQAEAKLVWKEAESQIMKLNITFNQYPNNFSTLTIDTIVFGYIGKINNVDTQFKQVSIRPSIILTSTNTSISINQTLLPPDEVDNFYFNVTMFAFTSANRDVRDKVLRFPDKQETIFVDRDKIVNFINLYGFPPDTFFIKWFPVYGSFIFIMTIPGLIVLFQKITKSKTSSLPEQEEKALEEKET